MKNDSFLRIWIWKVPVAITYKYWYKDRNRYGTYVVTFVSSVGFEGIYRMF